MKRIEIESPECKDLEEMLKLAQDVFIISVSEDEQKDSIGQNTTEPFSVTFDSNVWNID